MSALIPVEPPSQEARLETSSAPLREWVADARAAAEVAASLARTHFVPASLRERDPDATTANIAAALLTGQEMGLRPMAALRSIDVINGTPALRAIALRGLVQAHGHQIWVEEQTDTRAVVCGQRRGESIVQRSVWTEARAKNLKLLGKPNWIAQRGTMLVARATGECARWIAADVLMGLPYLYEELEDGEGAEGTGYATGAPPPVHEPRTAQRRTRAPRPIDTVRLPDPEPEPAEPEPEPEPEPDQPPESAAGETEPAPESAETGEQPPVSQQQIKALQAGFRDVGINVRANRLAVVTAIVNRAVTSANDLTQEEASNVIDVLNLAREKDNPGEWLMDLTVGDDESEAEQ